MSPTLSALTEPRFENPAWIHGIWISVLIVALSSIILRRRRTITDRFADDSMRDTVIGKPRRFFGSVRLLIALMGLSLLSIGAARPQANPHTEDTEVKGRDIVFVVDVSRSMLARDVAPNRLDRAKLWIRDLVSELKTDRVALVAFAGTSSVQSPLTTDRLFFDLALEELSPNSVTIGGTNIGDAIRKCMDLVFYDLDESEQGTHRDIVLITDGEDQESLPVDAASAAGAAGIRIISLGIGSTRGAPVLDEFDDPVERDGRAVTTSLDSSTLAKIAAASNGGVYLEVGTGDIDLAAVYQDLIASEDQATLGSAEATRWDELYLYAAIPGVVLLVLDALLGARASRRRVLA